MGRCYDGTISGRFAFALQDSDCFELFGFPLRYDINKIGFIFNGIAYNEDDAIKHNIDNPLYVENLINMGRDLHNILFDFVYDNVIINENYRKLKLKPIGNLYINKLCYMYNTFNYNLLCIKPFQHPNKRKSKPTVNGMKDTLRFASDKIKNWLTSVWYILNKAETPEGNTRGDYDSMLTEKRIQEHPELLKGCIIKDLTSYRERYRLLLKTIVDLELGLTTMDALIEEESVEVVCEI